MFFPSAVVSAVAAVFASTSNNVNTTSNRFFPYLFNQSPLFCSLLIIFFVIFIISLIIEFFKNV